jgi:hypothetical protein
MPTYEAKYANGTKTVTQDFEMIVQFVRDMKVSADVTVWVNGNAVLNFNIDAPGNK